MYDLAIFFLPTFPYKSKTFVIYSVDASVFNPFNPKDFKIGEIRFIASNTTLSLSNKKLNHSGNSISVFFGFAMDVLEDEMLEVEPDVKFTEILNEENGAPYMLVNKVKIEGSVSLSHSKNNSMAVVLLNNVKNQDK